MNIIITQAFWNFVYDEPKIGMQQTVDLYNKFLNTISNGHSELFPKALNPFWKYSGLGFLLWIIFLA